MTTHRTAPTPCPYCGHRLDACKATEGDAGAPMPGDFSICLKCINVLVFDTNIRPARPSMAELMIALKGPHMADVLRAARRFRRDQDR